jgi:bifunctional NMN adenylyltransferase/nudix hydrolase
MNRQYELAVYIGRFQPFHVAHQKTIEHGLEIADNVLILVGSAGGPRTIKNPWTYDERAEMIHMTNNQSERVHTLPLRDYTYDDNKWIRKVGEAVNDIVHVHNLDQDKIAIVGNDKDHSSFYLNYFPQWKFIEEPLFPPHGDSIDATKIRRLMFTGDIEFTRGVLPYEVYNAFVTEFIYSTEFALLKKEWYYVQDYKASWATAPFPPIFTTVDGIVIQSGHILLIQRGEFPGNGLWALPGGFIDENERVRAAVIRELREETKLKIPPKVLDRAIDAIEVFDDPGRSTRGRTITHAFRITLDPTQSLPKVKGADDAKHAKWIPLGELDGMEDVMYEDHFHIIKHMLSLPAIPGV